MDSIPLDLLDGGKLTIAVAVIFWLLTKGWLATKPHIQSLLDTIKYQREREVIRDEQLNELTEAVKQVANVMDQFRIAAEEKQR